MQIIINNYILDEVFVISGIIKAEVSVISQTKGTVAREPELIVLLEITHCVRNLQISQLSQITN